MQIKMNDSQIAAADCGPMTKAQVDGVEYEDITMVKQKAIQVLDEMESRQNSQHDRPVKEPT